VRLIVPSVDRTKLRAQMKRAATVVFDRARGLFLDAVGSTIEKLIDEDIHIETGMSAASYLFPLKSIQRRRYLLGRHWSAGDIGSRIASRRDPKKLKRKPLILISGTVLKDQYRTMEIGEELGRSSFKIELGTKGNPVMAFDFEINVFQYEINEAGWATIRKAENNFLYFIYKGFDDYLEFNKWKELIHPFNALIYR